MSNTPALAPQSGGPPTRPPVQRTGKWDAVVQAAKASPGRPDNDEGWFVLTDPESGEPLDLSLSVGTYLRSEHGLEVESRDKRMVTVDGEPRERWTLWVRWVEEGSAESSDHDGAEEE